MISNALASVLNGKARSSGEFFKTEREANELIYDLKKAGVGNPRKSKFVDYKLADGTKVYQYVVRWDMPKIS